MADSLPLDIASPELVAYRALVEELKPRFTDEQLSDISRAFETARIAHEGQVRKSGEPYITHPIAVAGIVNEMQLDHLSIIGALLHDVLEDCEVTREELASQFGETVADIVDGLSKLNSLEYKSKEEAQAESYRKMLLATVKDIRVMLIKLADRLHNMRTIGAMPRHKQRRIGQETLEVFAPIANRLGMNEVMAELENLSFETRYPMRYRVLSELVAQAHKERGSLGEDIVNRVKTVLSEKGLNASITSREKHQYSLYRKMQQKRRQFKTVLDMFAIRIIVDNIDDCYITLGILHQMYKPKARRFKDYIAVPKANGYQSLHTVLVHDTGEPVEVQIRTSDMNQIANSGVAAHWAYREGETSNPTDPTERWIEELKNLQSQSDDSAEFIENVKVDLFPTEIYVFTPKGRIVQLPFEATPVDFAYAVHSDVGNACRRAMVDELEVALSTKLESGQTVKIETGDSMDPQPMWMNFVVTGKARAGIRQYLRNLDHARALEFGHRLVKRALDRYDQPLADMESQHMEFLLAEYGFAELEDLFRSVGLGHHLPSSIAVRLMQIRDGQDGDGVLEPLRETAPLLIEGREGSVVQLSKCCCPIPGDEVQGVITAGQGVAVHRAGCRNVRRFRRRTKEYVLVEWAHNIDDAFEANLVVHLVHQTGALARITATLSMMAVNIEHMDFNNGGGDNVVIRFELSVSDRKHLARIVRRLRNLTVVRSVRRET